MPAHDALKPITGHSCTAPPENFCFGVSLRPPANWRNASPVEWTLQHSNLQDCRKLPGVVAVCQRNDFLGIIAASRVHAMQAAASVEAVWTPVGQKHLNRQTNASPSGENGRFIWSYPARNFQRESVIAWSSDEQLTVWLPAANEQLHTIRRDLACLLEISPEAVTLIAQTEATSPHPALLSLLDAAADAALLSSSVKRPVCVDLRSAPAGELSLTPAPPDSDDVARQQWRSPSQWLIRPSQARRLITPDASGSPLSACTNVQIISGNTFNDAEEYELHAAATFAQECHWHDLAHAARENPAEYRIRHLGSERARTLAKRVWTEAEHHPLPPTNADSMETSLHGRGFAIAQLERTEPDTHTRIWTWSAWVVDVTIDAATGNIQVSRVIAGHDSDSLHEAASAQISIENPALLTETRRLLESHDAFDAWDTRPGEDATLGNLAQRTLPSAPRTTGESSQILTQGQLDISGVISLPAAAAIGNAVFAATGIRLRRFPFDSTEVQHNLAQRSLPTAVRRSSRYRTLAAMGAWTTALAGLATLAWPLKPALPLTDGPDISLFSAQALERGRLVASAGDCAVCHTAPGSPTNSGGREIDTPFGKIYSTNITPDTETGIGRWSFEAFNRAMREGIHQDGRQLYPAFPYTDFAKLSEADMQALYGYLMSQPPVHRTATPSQLRFPFDFRPAVAAWNLLFHDNRPFQPVVGKSAAWNRGAYLVEGLGHCGACHTPRNHLGAEKTATHHLRGGMVDGWTAPALHDLTSRANPWTSEQLFQYLSTGYSPQHGVAAGPMAPVVAGLAELPESDVRAMITYLLDLPGASETEWGTQPSASPTQQNAAPTTQGMSSADEAALQNVIGARIFSTACAGCHDPNAGPTLFGVKPDLSWASSLQSAEPSNVLQVILHGIKQPAHADLGYMPGFADALDNSQVQDLLSYLRSRFSPTSPAWQVSPAQIDLIRSKQGHTTR